MFTGVPHTIVVLLVAALIHRTSAEKVNIDFRKYCVVIVSIWLLHMHSNHSKQVKCVCPMAFDVRIFYPWSAPEISIIIWQLNAERPKLDVGIVVAVLGEFRALYQQLDPEPAPYNVTKYVEGFLPSLASCVSPGGLLPSYRRQQMQKVRLP